MKKWRTFDHINKDPEYMYQHAAEICLLLYNIQEL